jgi:cytochrome c biogenesis protein CcmG/thiol:disulfide interchange protein DsbE
VEHPYLLQIAQEGVPIYGLNYKDDDAAAARWLADLGDPYRANIADRQGTLGLDLGVYGAPETYLLDAEGVVRYRHVGVVDERVWQTILQPLYLELTRQDSGG